jgi:hypothetical protein
LVTFRLGAPNHGERHRTPAAKETIIMLNRKILAAFILAGAALTPVTSFAAGNTDSRPCILKEHRITSVTPYNVEERAGRATIKRLRGAEVRVQAEPGLTAEWLQLTLARHVVEMRGMSMRDCALDLSDVQVRVDSAGSGFSVKLIARDAKKAEEVLRRAQMLVR